MSIFDVSQIAVEREIKTRLELVALASQQKREGKTDLAQFIANTGSKAVGISSLQKWKIERGWGVLSEIPSMVGVWIFSGTTH